MIIETVIICILGTLLHFTYDWSRHNKVVALFSAVNESTWEHIKMALSAAIFCSIFDAFFYGSNPNYFMGKFVQFSLMIITMPLIFYTYTHFTGHCILAIDIASFFVTVIAGMLGFAAVMNMEPLSHTFRYIGGIGVFAVFGFYMVLTLMPLKNFLFIDPITNDYGLDAHR